MVQSRPAFLHFCATCLSPRFDLSCWHKEKLRMGPCVLEDWIETTASVIYVLVKRLIPFFRDGVVFFVPLVSIVCLSAIMVQPWLVVEGPFENFIILLL